MIIDIQKKQYIQYSIIHILSYHDLQHIIHVCIVIPLSFICSSTENEHRERKIIIIIINVTKLLCSIFFYNKSKGPLSFLFRVMKISDSGVALGPLKRVP